MTETAESRTRIERYDPTSIEPHWQARWAELGLYDTDLSDDSRPKFYLLTMYPYPSGDLHIGHWYIVTPTDAVASTAMARPITSRPMCSRRPRRRASTPTPL